MAGSPDGLVSELHLLDGPRLLCMAWSQPPGASSRSVGPDRMPGCESRNSASSPSPSAAFPQRQRVHPCRLPSVVPCGWWRGPGLLAASSPWASSGGRSPRCPAGKSEVLGRNNPESPPRPPGRPAALVEAPAPLALSLGGTAR